MTTGTLRHAVIQDEPLWIVFASDMNIHLNEELVVNSFKTIDGRGAPVHIANGACITIQNATNVIVHNIHVHHCTPSSEAYVRSSPKVSVYRSKSDSNGIHIENSCDVWIDHCSLSYCTDGLVDVTLGSTGITISNNYFSNHDKVMLLGHNDDYLADSGMQVTVVFNHFGEGLTQRCRRGYVHVVNNDYTKWGLYAIGGSAGPTIYSQGNRFVAADDSKAKEASTI